MSSVLNNILNGYANYFVGPIIGTLIFVIVLFSSYNSSGNFDLITTFCGNTSIVSALILSVALHNILNGKKNCVDLFSISFISLLMSIISILFFKTYSFLHSFAVVSGIFSAFVFFSIFVEIIRKIQNHNETK